MVIEAFDEFGVILWYELPLAYGQHLKGNLTGTKGRIGTKPLFYFSENHTEENKSVQRNRNAIFYTHDKPKFPPIWTPPPLKEHYKNDKFVYNKPIVTINNKCTTEWGTQNMYNYFDANMLHRMFTVLEKKFQVVYIRPPYSNTKNYAHDKEQRTVNIHDNEVLKRHSSVICINDVIDEDSTYNETQFKLLANSEYHIAPAGDAVVPSYFGGELLIYFHPKCKSSNRKVWHTDSWLKELSGCNVTGISDYNDIISHISKW
jgi:16S rRNA G966 N2-methylase RsmD